MKRLALLFGFLMIALARPAGAVENVVASVNASDEPAVPDNWGATDVGWLFTPTTTFTVTDLGTEFGSSGGSVTADIFSNLPGSGGTLLASGTLGPVGDTITYATLDVPVELLANTTYFIAFENVEDLGVNVTSDLVSTSLGSLHFDLDGSHSFSMSDLNATDLNSQPILSFADNAVPEPSTWALLLASLAGVGFFRRLRSQAQR